MKKAIQIPEAMEIPYFDHGKNLSETIRNSSKRRGMSKLHFLLRKIRNTILYRLAYFCPINSWRIWMHRRRGVQIGKDTYIGQMCAIDNAYPEYVVIGDNVSIAGEVTIVAHVNPYAHFKGIFDAKVNPVVIGDGAWIGVKSALLPGAKIGEYAVVSAGTVVNGKVPPYTLVAGNPAKKIYNYKETMHQNGDLLPNK